MFLWCRVPDRWANATILSAFFFDGAPESRWLFDTAAVYHYSRLITFVTFLFPFYYHSVLDGFPRIDYPSDHVLIGHPEYNLPFSLIKGLYQH